MNTAFVLGLVLVASATVGASVDGVCEGNSENCTPNYSSFALVNASNKIDADFAEYTSQLVDKSFYFLIMSSEFDKYHMDRPGFQKLYRKMSDKAWEDAIDLMKYRSRRGVDGYLKQPDQPYDFAKKLSAMTELSSLQTAVEVEKSLATKAHLIHQKVSHDHFTKSGAEKIHYDPDTAHYLDEKIINYQSGVLRDLAGYVQTLHKITKNGEVGKDQAEDLALHLFDEYLEKSL
ncbi:AGAP002464-PA-like protein [Anopheles sinensis]|uniref:Ferritin n=1 Tax=Anopheles sinensis TaxID=74873 RepID=A0A084WRD5_ANOSI|nr:AGAP002464-PA-like protein [Anopheles sinensis]